MRVAHGSGRKTCVSVVGAAIASLCLTAAHGQPAGGTGAGSATGQDLLETAPFTIDYSLRAEAEYVRNLGFSGRSSPISRIVPGVTFRSDSETLKLAGDVSLLAVHYWNDQVGTSRTTEPRFTFTGSLLRERSVFGLSSSLFRSSTLFGTDQASANGFRLSQDQRTFFTLAPNFSYSITERFSVNASYGFNTVTYSQRGPGLVDSTGHSVGTGVQYRLNELETIGASISAARFRTDPDTTSSETRSAQVLWDRRWSEVTSTTAYVGYTQSEQTGLSNQLVCLLPIEFCQQGLFPFQVIQVGTNVTNRTPTYGATFTTQLDQRTSVSARVDRGVQAGATGTLTERTTFSTALSHRYSESLTGFADYAWTRTGFVGTLGGGSNAQNSSTLQRVSVGFRYQLPDNWAISGVARMTQTDTNVADPLERAILFALSKTWPNNRLWP